MLATEVSSGLVSSSGSLVLTSVLTLPYHSYLLLFSVCACFITQSHKHIPHRTHTHIFPDPYVRVLKLINKYLLVIKQSLGVPAWLCLMLTHPPPSASASDCWNWADWAAHLLHSLVTWWQVFPSPLGFTFQQHSGTALGKQLHISLGSLFSE